MSIEPWMIDDIDSERQEETRPSLEIPVPLYYPTESPNVDNEPTRGGCVITINIIGD